MCCTGMPDPNPLTLQWRMTKTGTLLCEMKPLNSPTSEMQAVHVWARSVAQAPIARCRTDKTLSCTVWAHIRERVSTAETLQHGRDTG